VDPDSNPPSRLRRFGAASPARRVGAARPPRRAGRGLSVAVTDGRGRPVAAGGLGRWLSRVAPARARGTVAIALVSDAHIQKLNRQYRRKDKPTDVLSFPADLPATLKGRPTTAGRPTTVAGRGFSLADPTAEPRAPTALLGDIAIATGVARRQAKAAGHSYETELRVLALHGLLHLLGYDHDGPVDNGRMARVEARLRRKGGLREGLIARTGRGPTRSKK
jgi:probable rRNA maturation factor